MFCVINEENRVIAFHDDEDVVEAYVERIQKQHNKEFTIASLSKKKANKIVDLDNLYLVRWGDTYVQCGFTQYLDLVSSQSIYDKRYCKEVLLKILETDDLSEKERKHISKTVEIVDKSLEVDETYTPTIEELQRLKTDYEPYMYNMDLI